MKKISSSEQAFSVLTRAARRGHPLTVSYTREDGSQTVRTIEVYMITRNKEGDRYARAMVRTENPAGELRTFRLDRITAVTEHRTRYLLVVPAPKHLQTPVSRPVGEILREMHEGTPAVTARTGRRTAVSV
jgi:predicted DNA-binding transcriptional regulator YafY